MRDIQLESSLISLLDGDKLPHPRWDDLERNEERIALAVCEATGMTPERWDKLKGAAREPGLQKAIDVAAARQEALETDPETETAVELARTDLSNPAPPTPENTHSADFRSVRWFGTSYSFTSTQAGCVKVLWEAFEKGAAEVGQVQILLDAGSDGQKLRDVFEKGNHPAWKVMIVSPRKGSYSLQKPV